MSGFDDRYKYGLSGEPQHQQERDCSPYGNDISDEIVQKTKDFLVNKIKDAYFGNQCLYDVLTSMSSYPYDDDYELDDKEIYECLRKAFKEIEGK